MLKALFMRAHPAGIGLAENYIAMTIIIGVTIARDIFARQIALDPLKHPVPFARGEQPMIEEHRRMAIIFDHDLAQVLQGMLAYLADDEGIAVMRAPRDADGARWQAPALRALSL